MAAVGEIGAEASDASCPEFPGCGVVSVRPAGEELVKGVVGGEFFEGGEPGLLSELACAGFADDGAEARAAVGERDGEAMERADGVEEASDGVAVLEGFVGGVRFAPDEDAARSERRANGFERGHGVDHVMDAVEGADQIAVALREGLFGGCGEELDIAEVMTKGEGAGGVDALGVVVDAEEARVGEGAGHGDGGLAASAADVDDLGAQLQPFGETRHFGEPLGDEEVEIAGAEDLLDGARDVGADLGVGDAAAIAEAVSDPGDVVEGGHGEFEGAAGEQGGVLVREDGGLSGGHDVAPGGGVEIEVFGGDHGLEPFADIAFVEAGGGGEFGAGSGAGGFEGLEEAELVADVAEGHEEGAAVVIDDLVGKFFRFLHIHWGFTCFLGNRLDDERVHREKPSG